MKIEHTGLFQPWAISAACAAVLLAACGGGGSSTGSSAQTAGTPASSPQVASTQSISGLVIDGPIQGATVCLDLNGNGKCDAGEPTSSATDAKGNYTISGVTAAQAGAPLIAVIPAGAVDAVNGTVATAYTLSAPGGKSAVISPITTLVQAGITQGLTQTSSESAVAAQLQVSAASLYNDYTTSSSSADNAMLAAVVPTVVAGLQGGQTPVLATSTTSTTPTPGYWVREFSYTGPGYYYLNYYYSTNVPTAAGVRTYYDERIAYNAGVPLPASLYDGTLAATPTGWQALTGATPNTSTSGSPYISRWGYGYVYASSRVETDVSGQSIASVVATVQDLKVNTTSTLVGVPANLTGTMPTGAVIRRVTSTNTSSPVKRSASNYLPGVTTLAGMVSAFPVPTGTGTPSNTVGIGQFNTCASTATTCQQTYMRAAFGANNTATYYLCDSTVNPSQSCQLGGTGTYTVGTAVDQKTPIMTFAGLPAAANVQTFTRVFVEQNGHVYPGWQDKPVTTTTTRLNKVAFEALAKALGITPPQVGSDVSVFAGNWSASYSGGDTGSCSAVIDATGSLNGTCTSTTVGGNFGINGTVSSTGVASFSTGGVTTSAAVFSGSFVGATGSGNWTWSLKNLSGTWSASKQ